MDTKEATIQNATGFHIRPAQLFSEQATKFKSQINIYVKGEDGKVDGKSILGLMSLGLEKGRVILIEAEGPDEQEAVETLAGMIEDGFGEA